MHTIIAYAKKLTLYLVVAVTISAYPMAAFAEETPPSEEASTPQPVYTFNPDTGRWDSDEWVYNPATGVYEPYVAPLPPAPIESAPAAPEPAVVDGSTNTATVNQDTTNAIDNTVTATSLTGDATVQSNLSAGGATSGDALSIATLINNINSTSALSGSTPVTFTSDIYGDVYGDIELAPELLKAMAQTTSAPVPSSQNLTYNATNKNDVTNTLDLASISGNASVLSNTLAGDATSGNATAIANVLNIVNSVIAANQSFVGTINIHGNLDGDILMSKDGSPTLLASNAASAPLSAGNLIANQYNLASIINNIDLGAQSGAATVDSNTTAGGATTGTADTNLVIMNLAGQNVVAKNSLLVFVNVLGKWVGIIVDAPTGATAAVLGDDVTSHLLAAQGGGDTNIQARNTTTLTNNISLQAQSGDATVAGNTTAGGATSGNANVAATVLNMANSAFSVSDWFGVLFINVLGSWYGSFGVDTEQGGKAHQEVAAGAPPQAAIGGGGQAVPAPAQVFRFISHAAEQVTTQSPRAEEDFVAVSAEPAVGTNDSDPAVLAASDSDTSSGASLGHGIVGEEEPLISVPIAVASLLLTTGGAYLVIRLIGGVRERLA